MTNLTATKLKAVQTFTSYAHDDDPLAAKFLKELDIRFKISTKFSYTRWSDHMIPLGVNWKKELKLAVDNCDAGILLVSPNFLASDTIQTLELPRLAKNKILLPVMLRRVDFGSMEMGKLKGLQVFLYKGSKGEKSFEECRPGAERTAFMNQLFKKIEGGLP